MIFWTINVLLKINSLILQTDVEVFVMDVFLLNACDAGLSARPYLPLKVGGFYV